ncbi:hypothetical protein POM88_013820 [Heracleum sosnowskyi]|uniref:Transposase (putative) gypsy type domain-containing protein n=1 Tax=Heracleum sosnowskyi TaxID=360622 RepID=A0AAD8IZ97_9APIA|nr:hypothetical protein POM88_013820 [Heracleum sosnowskyi]
MPEVDEEYGSVALEIFEKAFFYGLSTPIAPCSEKLLKYTMVALGQLDPNIFIHINSFQNRCLKAGVKPRLSLLLHHFDFRKNAKSVGFYQLARRTGRAGWDATNSSNRGTHDHWFFISGHKLRKYSVWREIDPAIIIAPELSDAADKVDYARLCAPQEPNRILLIVSRDQTWLRALWGTVSTRVEMLQRAQAKNAKRLAELVARKNTDLPPEISTEAASEPPSEKTSPPPSEDVEIIDTTVPEADASGIRTDDVSKWARGSEGEVVWTY